MRAAESVENFTYVCPKSGVQNRTCSLTRTDHSCELQGRGEMDGRYFGDKNLMCGHIGVHKCRINSQRRSWNLLDHEK